MLTLMPPSDVARRRPREVPVSRSDGVKVIQSCLVIPAGTSKAGPSRNGTSASATGVSSRVSVQIASYSLRSEPAVPASTSSATFIDRPVALEKLIAPDRVSPLMAEIDSVPGPSAPAGGSSKGRTKSHGLTTQADSGGSPRACAAWPWTAKILVCVAFSGNTALNESCGGAGIASTSFSAAASSGTRRARTAALICKDDSSSRRTVPTSAARRRAIATRVRASTKNLWRSDVDSPLTGVRSHPGSPERTSISSQNVYDPVGSTMNATYRPCVLKSVLAKRNVA